MKGTGEYPKDWKQIAKRMKDKFEWKCERCGLPHKTPSQGVTGQVLTVHHLDMDRGNCEEWNLAVLCQKCHLQIQAKVRMEQKYMLPHSKWFKPHVEGYELWKKKKVEDVGQN